MRTTLTLDDDVAVRLERLREERDASFKSIVNEALRRGLERMEGPPEARPPYRIRPFSPGRCRLPSLDDVTGVLAAVEGEDFR